MTFTISACCLTVWAKSDTGFRVVAKVFQVLVQNRTVGAGGDFRDVQKVGRDFRRQKRVQCAEARSQSAADEVQYSSDVMQSVAEDL